VTSTSAPSNIGMVGVGNMGMPIARRLSDAHYALHFFARRPEVVAEAQGLGATTAGTLAILGATSDLVIINVFNDEQLREVALGPDGLIAHMHPGSVLISHTTGHPSTIQEIAIVAEGRSIATLDCAMSGGPTDIDAGRLTLLVGGDAKILSRVHPVLASYSSPILHVGQVGDSQKVKLLNNALFAAQVALALRIEQCALEMGMEPAPVLQAIRECSGNSYALGVAVDMASAKQLVEVINHWIKKDLEVCTRVAAELGADLGDVLATARVILSEDARDAHTTPSETR
jgi:3-hydroxyisobutyrate dehydrogenase-like beta-hydroxyacid dehydrogenase